MKKMVFMLILAASCSFAAEAPKPATEFTKAANQAVLKELDFNDRHDFEDAKRGLIAAHPAPIKTADGRTAYSITAFDFLKSDTVPDTVNPSLWRVAQLNIQNGLFKVTDGIYQIRGLDISNMTIIEGKEGVLLIDPLVSTETAKAGLDLYYANVAQPATGKRPVKAVIHSHSHVDHFGGVRGVVDQKDVDSGKTVILAPEGFFEEAVAENIYAGNAMSRRGIYMYGLTLPYSPTGTVGSGLGTIGSVGSITLIPPTDIVKKTGETRTIDGVNIEFLMAPGTEAPAEMIMYFPQFKALCAAEDATHTQHNLYTLRGAQVRDANKWWRAIDAMIKMYGDKTDVLFAQHHWPRWGKESINTFLANQRDGYKYMHDQTLNLANKGFTPIEIGEMVKLPPEIDRQWYMRGYYGTLNHNVKAIYQRYLGWYDSNPANLYPLPPTETAKRYVEAMGGADNAIAKGREAYAKGDYRWVAELMKHVVFADPENQAAKNLQADAFEQLGYQSEAGPWRNEFLAGAYELRNGVVKNPATLVSLDMLSSMTNEMLFDYAGITLNGSKAIGKSLKFNWVIPGGSTYGFWLENGILMYEKDLPVKNPDATITAAKVPFTLLMMKATPLKAALEKKSVAISGDSAKVEALIALFDSFDKNFNIIVP